MAISYVLNPFTGNFDAVNSSSDVVFSQVRYVAKNGDNSTGDGSLSAPYLTVQAAMASITDATSAKLYAIQVEAGDYSETGFTLKPNVFVIGLGTRVTLIDCSDGFSLDAAWQTGGTKLGGIKACTFTTGTGGIDFDISGGSAAQTVFWIEEAALFPSGNFAIEGNANGANFNVSDAEISCSSIIIESAQIIGRAARLDANVAITGVSAVDSLLTAYNSDITTLSMLDTAGNATATLHSSFVGTITADGTNSTISATVDSIPVNAQVTLTGGATITYLNSTGSGTITAWDNTLTFTPSAGFGTATSVDFWSRRVGDSLQVRGSFVAGTLAASAAFISIPGSLTIDTAKIPAGITARCGEGALLNAAAGPTVFIGASGSEWYMNLNASNTTDVFMSFRNTSGTYKTDTPATFGITAGDTISVEFEVPIVEYA